jgi:hypothetical protein
MKQIKLEEALRRFQLIRFSHRAQVPPPVAMICSSRWAVSQDVLLPGLSLSCWRPLLGAEVRVRRRPTLGTRARVARARRPCS